MNEQSEEIVEYIATGEVTLRGVTFYIKAASLEEARRKARAGEWDDYETAGAETSDWDIETSSVEENC